MAVRFPMSAVLLVAFAMSAGARPVIVPAPKQLEFATPSISLSDSSVAIVLGSQCSDPEVYAAETLQYAAQKRFGPRWPIVREDTDLARYRVLIVLGQRNTSSILDRLCKQWKVDLSETSPGHDGYVLEMRKVGKQDLVLVGGSNPRAVIFGQDTLFQLMAKENGRLVLARASVRDWPTIPWRGKPQTNIEIHLAPGVMDWYLRSRMNFTDLRNGIYAFEPEDRLDTAKVSAAIREAHRRGMIVYASVNCGVEKSRHDAILRKFEEFLSLGADGLLMSFDDKGPGESPVELVKKVVELGRRHRITGHLLATTPPGGSYQVIASDFNRKVVAVPGMEDAIWLFSAAPSARGLADARSIGLREKPGWWHNWPRVPGHGMIGRSSYAYGLIGGTGYNRKNDRPVYLPVPTLEQGWHQPTYEQLAGAGEWTSAVMQWGGSAWKLEYTYPVLGWWAWNPSQHDWKAVRTRIYDLVFGPGNVEAAMAYDDALGSLRKLFTFNPAEVEGEISSPARLLDPNDRPKARKLVQSMTTALEQLEHVRPEDSFVVDAARLNDYFLDAMRAELSTARACTELTYPEYWWDGYQRTLLSAIYDGDLARANRLIADARPRVVAQVNQAQAKLTELSGVDRYAKAWTEKASLDADGWRKLLDERRSRFLALVDLLEDRKFGNSIGRMLAGIDSPPRDLEVVTTVMPGDRQYFSGAWLAGSSKKYGRDVFIFAYPLKQGSRIGDYCEVEISVPLDARRGWRGVRFFINSWTNDIIADENMVGRYLGRRFIRLLYGDRVLWEEDVSLPRGDGRWVTVGVPEIVGEKHIKLRLRVEDEEESYNYSAAVFISPFQVLIRPR